MAKKKACKSCKLFVEGNVCPGCKGNSFTDNWQGRLYVTDVENSEIAEKLNVKLKGEYAIKIR
jgi:DNA-directed RNA polymerase subunit E"